MAVDSIHNWSIAFAGIIGARLTFHELTGSEADGVNCALYRLCRLRPDRVGFLQRFSYLGKYVHGIGPSNVTATFRLID